MLPKKFRLSKQEFKQVMDNGQMASGRLMGVLLSEARLRPMEQDFGEAKAGIIVSKKLSNKAVVRNKLKRRLRAAIQSVLPEIHSGLYFVVLPNRLALAATVEELKKEIDHLIIEN